MKAQPQSPLQKLTPRQRQRWERELNQLWPRGEPGPRHGYEHLTYAEASWLLAQLANIQHPAVRPPRWLPGNPKQDPFEALLRGNPREDFLRRLAASHN